MNVLSSAAWKNSWWREIGQFENGSTNPPAPTCPETVDPPGPGGPYPLEPDLDGDADVDLADVLIFQLYLSGQGNCVCAASGSEEPFTDDGGQTFYTRASVRERLREHCRRNAIPFP